METIRKIRCAHQRDGKSIRQIAREFHLSRNTVKKVLRGEATEFTYARTAQPLPKLGPYTETLEARVTADATKPVRERRTAQVLYDELQREGYAAAMIACGATCRSGGDGRTASRARSTFHKPSIRVRRTSLTGVMNWSSWAACW